jgi:hypothetical protein
MLELRLFIDKKVYFGEKKIRRFTVHRIDPFNLLYRIRFPFEFKLVQARKKPTLKIQALGYDSL